MGPQCEGDPHTAMWLLICGMTTEEERKAITEAILGAVDAALQSVEQDLSRSHTPELHARHHELIEFAGALAKEALAAEVRIAMTLAGALDPANGRVHEIAWRMVLAHMTSEQQQLLQAAFVRFRDTLEQYVITGDDPAHAQQVLVALDPAQQLLAELPFTSLPPPGPGPDTHDHLRRTLTVEIERESPVDDDGDRGLGARLMRVEWRDGYQMRVAKLDISSFASDGASWVLEVEDPSPGRSEQLLLPGTAEAFRLYVAAEAEPDPRAGARMQREGNRLLEAAAERELQHAIRWGTRQLGEHYTVRAQTGEVTRPGLHSSLDS
jgi:hypothetical protein